MHHLSENNLYVILHLFRNKISDLRLLPIKVKDFRDANLFLQCSIHYRLAYMFICVSVKSRLVRAIIIFISMQHRSLIYFSPVFIAIQWRLSTFLFSMYASLSLVLSPHKARVRTIKRNLGTASCFHFHQYSDRVETTSGTR